MDQVGRVDVDVGDPHRRHALGGDVVRRTGAQHRQRVLPRLAQHARHAGFTSTQSTSDHLRSVAATETHSSSTRSMLAGPPPEGNARSGRRGCPSSPMSHHSTSMPSPERRSPSTVANPSCRGESKGSQRSHPYQKRRVVSLASFEKPHATARATRTARRSPTRRPIRHRPTTRAPRRARRSRPPRGSGGPRCRRSTTRRHGDSRVRGRASTPPLSPTPARRPTRAGPRPGRATATTPGRRSGLPV